MNNDANTFAGYEPNPIGGPDDLGCDFDLAGAAGRAARTWERSRSGINAVSTTMAMAGNESSRTFGAETKADPTVPPLPEEEGQVAAEPEDPSTELLRKLLAESREPDVSRVKLAKMSAPTGSRGLPPAKAWQDWFTIRLRTWANVISPEFETELVKKVLGQPADLSRHGVADRQHANEICFDIDDKTVPYLLGADLSSGCAILRVLLNEILASTAEHTTALHERCAKPVPCRDKTKLLLTLGQWLADLKELQAAGNSASKERQSRVASETSTTCMKSRICWRHTSQDSCTLPLNEKPPAGR